MYVKGNPEFWYKDAFTPARRELLATRLQGKYLKTTVKDPDVKTAVGMTEIRSSVFDFLDSNNSVGLSVGGRDVVNGVPTVELVSDHSPARLYVATSGPPYPVQADEYDGTVDFLDYGATVTLTPPPPAEVIDVASLP